jgi:hypothetical protein
MCALNEREAIVILRIPDTIPPFFKNLAGNCVTQDPNNNFMIKRQKKKNVKSCLCP